MKPASLSSIPSIPIPLSLNTRAIGADPPCGRLHWFRDANFGTLILLDLPGAPWSIKQICRAQRHEAMVHAVHAVDVDAMEWLRIAQHRGRETGFGTRSKTLRRESRDGRFTSRRAR